MRALRSIRIAALAASVALIATLFAPSPAAYAAAGVTVVNAAGTSTVDPDYATEVTVSGTGFQSISHGFGGVYVLFGWADSGSSWKPSNGGVVGRDFRYVPDSESQENQGFQRFVSFPGSDTEGAAHAVMGADGSWSVTMVIPGASFESRDRDGEVSSVDCLEVTCGIITIGAHGVKNANNETFTPLTFAAPATGATVAQPSGSVRVGLATPTVDAGTSIAFTGQGFSPGEQIVATLDNGLVSVGPLVAGAQGEVAGVLPVPRDVRDGTHLVTLTGAASGAVAEAQVTIDVPQSLVSTPAGAETPMWVFVLLMSTILLALVLVTVSVVTSVRRVLARRRATRAATAAAHPQQEPGDAMTFPLDVGTNPEAGDDPDAAETLQLPVAPGSRT